jgi:hypothetical protein
MIVIRNGIFSEHGIFKFRFKNIGSARLPLCICKFTNSLDLSHHIHSCRERTRDVVQIRGQGFVSLHGRAVINERNDRDPDIFFNSFEQRFADQSRAAEQGIDMDK